MAKYSIEGTTLSNIADAIREKAGITNPLFPEQMPSYIRSIKVEDSDSDYTGYPDYVIAEGKRVASGMLSKRGGNSITAIMISDMHNLGDNDAAATTVEQTRRCNMNAGQGAKVIADNIDVDFVANLGDFCFGAKTSTMSDFVQGIAISKSQMEEVAKDHETFYTPGNHDTATYGFAQNNDYLRQGSLNALIGTYRYVDFEDKKVRVICLNTAEVEGLAVSGDSGTHRMTGTQLQWFANALDLSAKNNAAEWGIIIMSHAPLDWDANILPAANCLQAYISGSNFSVTHNGVSVSKNFSGKNAAKVICQFHGHVHGFRVDKIRYGSSGNLQTMDVKRIAIPNAYFNRNNEYGENSGADSNGLEFGETTTYRKTDYTAQNTAFCLVSVDLDNEIIYADCYGAGYDRVISYAEVVIVTYTVSGTYGESVNSNGTTTAVGGSPYTATINPKDGYIVNTIKVTMGGTDVTSSAVNGNNISIANVTGDIVITVTTKADPNVVAVTNSLTNATTNNSATTAKIGNSYTASIAAKDGYVLTSVIVTMNGTNVTSSVYSNGVINISSVTGAIVITAVAMVKDDFNYGTFTNRVPISEARDSTAIYNGVGYKNNTYPSETNDGSASGIVCTGWIPFSYATSSTLYIKGATLDTTNDYVRIFGFNNKTSVNSSVGYSSGSRINTNYNVEVLGDKYYKLTPKNNNASVTYIRVSLVGTGENLIVTTNEAIHAGSLITYSITNSLTNATTSNSTASVYKGVPYSATISAKSGYTLGAVRVTMGGTDVTASVVSGGKVTIAKVTGNIVITATATQNAPTTYTVTNNLTNATTSNSATSVTANSAYSATITANNGYELSSVTVTMGGTNITSSAYSGGKVTISSVTGNIVITAIATETVVTPTYTNLVPQSTAYNSTAVYNGTGYKDGYYLSSSGAPFESTDSATTLTGYIPYACSSSGVPGTIYIKGAEWAALSHVRMFFFDSGKTTIKGPQINGAGSGNASLSTFYTVETLGTNYYKLTPIKNANGNWNAIGMVATVADARYVRFSLKGKGANLIITLNEPIE